MHSEGIIHNRCHFKLTSDFFSPQSVLQSQTYTHKVRDGHTFELRTLAQVTFVTIAKCNTALKTLGPRVPGSSVYSVPLFGGPGARI